MARLIDSSRAEVISVLDIGEEQFLDILQAQLFVKAILSKILHDNLLTSQLHIHVSTACLLVHSAILSIRDTVLCLELIIASSAGPCHEFWHEINAVHERLEELTHVLNQEKRSLVS